MLIIVSITTTKIMEYTFVSNIPIKTRRGRAIDTTRASLQLVINASTKLAMKVVKNCRKMATLSPIPE